jgi:hypothetical protein
VLDVLLESTVELATVSVPPATYRRRRSVPGHGPVGKLQDTVAVGAGVWHQQAGLGGFIRLLEIFGISEALQ